MTQPLTIGIIGAGAIGFNLAQSFARNKFDVVLYNRYHTEKDGSPSKTWIEKEGKVDDLNDALEYPIKLTHNISDLERLYALVITAGATRKEGETRADLARKNAAIIREYIPVIAENPETLVMVVSNPVDGLTHYLIEKVADITNTSPLKIAKKIIGVSYVDTTRLRNLVREAIAKTHPELKRPEITGLVLGEHGPSMVPLISQVKVNNRPLLEFIRPEQVEQIVKGVVTRGNDIIIRTGTSAIAGPAIAVINMVKAMVTEVPVQFPASAFDGVSCIGRLVEFTGNKVSRLIDDLPMSTEEAARLAASREALVRQYQELIALDNIPSPPPGKPEEPSTYRESLDRINKAFGKPS